MVSAQTVPPQPVSAPHGSGSPADSRLQTRVGLVRRGTFSDFQRFTRLTHRFTQDSHRFATDSQMGSRQIRKIRVDSRRIRRWVRNGFARFARFATDSQDSQMDSRWIRRIRRIRRWILRFARFAVDSRIFATDLHRGSHGFAPDSQRFADIPANNTQRFAKIHMNSRLCHRVHMYTHTVNPRKNPF